jgi:hypothetical protein
MYMMLLSYAVTFLTRPVPWLLVAVTTQSWWFTPAQGVSPVRK